MKLRLLALLAFVGLAFVIQAQEDDKSRTLNLLNGRGWSTYDNEAKGIYLVGMLDGWTQRGNFEPRVLGKVLTALQGAKTYGEEVDLIDAGYKDPVNIELPVIWVLMAELAIKDGASQDAVFTNLRKLLTKIRTSKTWHSPTEDSPIDAILDASKPPPTKTQ